MRVSDMTCTIQWAFAANTFSPGFTWSEIFEFRASSLAFRTLSFALRFTSSSPRSMCSIERRKRGVDRENGRQMIVMSMLTSHVKSLFTLSDKVPQQFPQIQPGFWSEADEYFSHQLDPASSWMRSDAWGLRWTAWRPCCTLKHVLCIWLAYINAQYA